MPTCRKRMFAVEQNRYGYIVATIQGNEAGDWKCSFAKCWVCRLRFVAVRPSGMKIYPCPDCCQQVRVR